jgi:membrane fusion protein (multidrug efflux system)
MHFHLKSFTTSFVVITILCVLVGCGGKKKEADKPKTTPPVLVDVMIADRQSISDIIEANGTVLANEFGEIHPEVSGRLTYLNLKEGSYVAQGTVIARINDADLRAQIAKSKVQLSLALKTTERYKKLLDVNGINQSEYDIALNQVNGYNADIAYTQTLIDKTVIKAPFSGVIGLRQISPGAYITPATVLATIQQTSKLKIDFTLPQNYSNAIKKGDAVKVELDATSNTMGSALIVATEPGANTETRNLKVRALLAETNVNPGAFVKVFINAGKGRSSVFVPTNCIIPNDKDNQIIIVKNGMANFVDIKTGIRQENKVEVLSGVEVGDSVVVTGVLFARPKSKVKVRMVKKLSDLFPETAKTN